MDREGYGDPDAGASGPEERATYRDLLLGNYNGTVLAPEADRHDVGGGDGLEGIL